MYEFGPFLLDATDRVLYRDGQIRSVTPKGFDLLLALVRNAGRVLPKEQLMRDVWPDTFVEDNNLTVNISALRKILDAGSAGPSHIQTVSRRGYRFAADVRTSAPPPQVSPASRADTTTPHGFVVGREQELRKLESILTDTVRGAGRTVFITGEPGIGKTASDAFMRLIRSRYPEVRICSGRCLEQYGSGESYLAHSRFPVRPPVGT